MAGWHAGLDGWLSLSWSEVSRSNITTTAPLAHGDAQKLATLVALRASRCSFALLGWLDAWPDAWLAGWLAGWLDDEDIDHASNCLLASPALLD